MKTLIQMFVLFIALVIVCALFGSSFTMTVEALVGSGEVAIISGVGMFIFAAISYLLGMFGYGKTAWIAKSLFFSSVGVVLGGSIGFFVEDQNPQTQTVVPMVLGVIFGGVFLLYFLREFKGENGYSY